MRVLVVVGYCLKVNSSANLCHIAYIKGLIENGYEVDLLTVSSKNLRIDNSIDLPAVSKLYEYEASLYEQMSGKKAVEHTAQQQKAQSSGDSCISWKTKVKNAVRGLYGVYGTEYGWYLHAKSFRSDVEYDHVISLAYPPVSHKLADYLIRRKHIKTKHWTQIWEDPWYLDADGICHNEKVLAEEPKLLTKPDRVYYVSPLTLMYQKKAFPSVAYKMNWQPLPTYYLGKPFDGKWEDLHFGYFGDYNTTVRDLRPFLAVASNEKLRVTICGNTNLRVQTSEFVEVHPRQTLEQLRVFEEQANVLVYLCNSHGGQIPGKLYQYAATDRIILFILDGTEEEQQVLYDYFSQFNRFVFCNNTEESILEAIYYIKMDARFGMKQESLRLFDAKRIVNQILEGV